MDYFFMREDTRLGNAIKINISSEALKLQDHQVVFSEISDKTRCPDYMQKQIYAESFHLVSNDLYELIKLYCPDLKGYSLFLTDKDKLIQKHYWSIFPEKIYCLIEELKPNKKYLDGEKLESKHLFCVSEHKATYIVSGLCLTENILRKYPHGVVFDPVDVRGGSFSG